MKNIKILLIILAAGLLISSCTPPDSEPVPTRTLDSGAIKTEIADRVKATNTAMALTHAAAPVSTEIPPTDVPPATLAPTNTLLPSETPLPSLTPTITATEGPCNKAKFILDVTIPDGTEFTPGEAFTKTWRLQNVGTCTWDTTYKIVFASGDQMGGNPSKMLTSGTVAPGHTVDVSINMIAPANSGDYKGYWKLKAGDGSLFGIESPYDESFWVNVTVKKLYDFTVSLHSINICGYGPGVVFTVTNTGTLFFESGNWTIRDLDTVNQAYNGSDNPFGTTPTSCGAGDSDMDPGLTYYITAKFIGVIGGNNGRLTLELCSADGMAGTCITKVIEFIIPEVPPPPP